MKTKVIQEKICRPARGYDNSRRKRGSTRSVVREKLYKSSIQDAQKFLEIAEFELARKKAETIRMARSLSAKKLAVKRKKKEMKRVKRVIERTSSVNRRMQEMLDFLIAAEAENSDPETAMIKEAAQGMNDLNLEGNNIITPNQVQSGCSSGSAANGVSNRGYGGGHDGGCHN